MSIDQTQRNEFSRRLVSCADALKVGKRGNGAIRELQSYLRQLFFASTDGYLRTIAFVLDEWIKDYILNFAGDVVTPNSEDLDEIRERLLSESIALALMELAEGTRTSSEKAFAAIERLVVSYLDAIQEANKVVDETR
jgi:hypothetical protein